MTGGPLDTQSLLIHFQRGGHAIHLKLAIPRGSPHRLVLLYKILHGKVTTGALEPQWQRESCPRCHHGRGATRRQL